MTNVLSRLFMTSFWNWIRPKSSQINRTKSVRINPQNGDYGLEESGEEQAREEHCFIFVVCVGNRKMERGRE